MSGGQYLFNTECYQGMCSKPENSQVKYVTTKINRIN